MTYLLLCRQVIKIVLLLHVQTVHKNAGPVIKVCILTYLNFGITLESKFTLDHDLFLFVLSVWLACFLFNSSRLTSSGVLGDLLYDSTPHMWQMKTEVPFMLRADCYTHLQMAFLRLLSNCLTSSSELRSFGKVVKFKIKSGGTGCNIVLRDANVYMVQFYNYIIVQLDEYWKKILNSGFTGILKCLQTPFCAQLWPGG